MIETGDISPALAVAIKEWEATHGRDFSNRELGKYLKEHAGEGSDVHVKNLRSGHAKNPRVRVLQALGKYFGKSPLWFVTRDDVADGRAAGVLLRMQHLDPRQQDRILDTVQSMIDMLDESGARGEAAATSPPNDGS